VRQSNCNDKLKDSCDCLQSQYAHQLRLLQAADVYKDEVRTRTVLWRLVAVDRWPFKPRRILVSGQWRQRWRVVDVITWRLITTVTPVLLLLLKLTMKILVASDEWRLQLVVLTHFIHYRTHISSSSHVRNCCSQLLLSVVWTVCRIL